MQEHRLPHIILIVMDTAGAKRCSVYGHPRATTPGLERLAQEAMLYKYCFAPAPWTIPSHASLFSGLYASEHGCGVTNRDLPEAVHNLPDILSKMGYRTISLTSNLLVSQHGFEQVYGMNQLFNSHKFGEARKAFDAFKKQSQSELARLQFLITYCLKNKNYFFPFSNLLDRYYRKKFGKIKERSYYSTERTFFHAKQLLKKYGNDKPLFLFINLMETHWKYYPPKKYIKSLDIQKHELKKLLELDYFDMYIQNIPEKLSHKLAGLYEQELHYVSDKILDFFQFLETAGLKDRSLFIATSDHGESLGEHGLWGHTFGVFNEVIHIPLIIKYPRDLGIKGVSASIVQLHDVWATIMDMVDSPLPTPEASKSLLSERRDFAFCEHYQDVGLRAIFRREPHFTPTDRMQPCRCVIGADLMKLIEWQDGRLQCYDLKNDYGEKHDLMGSAAAAAQVSRLKDGLLQALGPFPSQAAWGSEREAPDSVNSMT
jgi:arylsulfatase A-like enzyme